MAKRYNLFLIQLTKSQYLKTQSILFLLIISLGAFLYYSYNQIFPYAPIFACLGAVLLLSSVLFSQPKTKNHWWLILIGCITLAVAFRAYIYFFPASYIGIDPDTYAAMSSVLRATGYSDGLEIQFYSIAPNFIYLPAIVGLIFNTSIRSASSVILLIFGILSPLISSILAYRFAVQERYTTASIGAVLGILPPMTVSAAIAPFPQTLSVIIFLCALLCLIKINQSNYHRMGSLILFLTLSMMFTHKLPVLVIFNVVAAIYFAQQIVPTLPFGPVNRSTKYISQLFLILIAVLAVIQYTVLTDLTGKIFRYGIAYFSVASGQTVGVDIVPTAAVAPKEALWIFQSHSHMILTLLLGGIGWAVMFWKYRHDNNSFVFLSVIAILVATVIVFIIGFFSSSLPQPTRFYMFAEIPLMAFLGVAGIMLFYRLGSQRAIFAVLFILIVFQGFSATVAPDFPSQPRSYLAESEADAKEWGTEYASSQIYTDYYFRHETVSPGSVTNPNDPAVYQNPKFGSYDEALFNRTLKPDTHPLIAHRPGLEVHRAANAKFARSSYVLTYDPVPMLERNYSQIYSNNDVDYYLY